MNKYSKNTFQSFWGVSAGYSVPVHSLQEQAERLFLTRQDLSDVSWDKIMSLSLGEEQFGENHFNLGKTQKLYYQLRPLFPDAIRLLLHRIVGSTQKNRALLKWPVEERLVCFLFNTMRDVLLYQQINTLEYVHFWPYRKRFAFVITHDIEAAAGQVFARRLAELDKKYGFRSSFNFVPEKYKIDRQFMEELRLHGFEIGVHGLNHDGKLYSSKAVFEKRAMKINKYIDEWGVAGFRSPLTHRNPEWMQSLNIEYDLSFFDTDSFEPISGGTMSIWPFQMGQFVELPYTLTQDHTLMVTLGETSPRLWVEKIEFIQKHCGMALVNVHPDYQRNPKFFKIYEEFLHIMSQRNDYWHALPQEVARWWKARAQWTQQTNLDDIQMKLPGATMGTIRLSEDSKEIEI